MQEAKVTTPLHALSGNGDVMYGSVFLAGEELCCLLPEETMLGGGCKCVLMGGSAPIIVHLSPGPSNCSFSSDKYDPSRLAKYCLEKPPFWQGLITCLTRLNGVLDCC